MKIAIVGTFIKQATSGAEISASLLADALYPDHEVEVFCARTDFKSLSVFSDQVLMFGSKFTDHLITKEVLKSMLKFKPDVIHVQDFSILPAVVNAFPHNDLPIIMTVRDYRFECNLANCEDGKVCRDCSRDEYNKCLKESVADRYGLKFPAHFISGWLFKRREIIRNSLKGVAHFITVSDYVARELKKSHPNLNNITTIYNCRPDWKPVQKEPSTTVTIFAAGLIVPQKGFQDLVSAVKHIADKYASLKVRIAGDGSYKDHLNFTIYSDALGDKIKLLGKINYDEMMVEYINSDIIVMPSKWPEPAGRILIEAQHMGRPLVSTKVGGSSEVVGEGAGFLVDSIQEMADALDKLIFNRNLRISMGQKGQHKITKDHSPEVVAKRHEEVYKQYADTTD